MTTCCDWAWLGGFLEGEGTFQIVFEKKGKARYTVYPQVAAVSVDRVLLERCREIAGGNFWGPFARKPGRSMSNPNWRPAFRWQIRSDAMTRAIYAIRPHLLTKAEQADILLLLRSNTQRGASKGHFGVVPMTDELIHWRHQLRVAVMALNRRGTKPWSAEERGAVDFARSELIRLQQTTHHQIRSAV